MSESPGSRAQRLLKVALELAGVVRDHDRDTITEHLTAIDTTDKDALIVVLAALVDVEQSAEQLLSWVTWDENGQPLKPRRFNPKLEPALATYLDLLRAGRESEALLVAHAEYVRLRKTRAPTPTWVSDGQRAYDAACKRAQKLRAVS